MAVNHLMKWVQRGEWLPRLTESLANHRQQVPFDWHLVSDCLRRVEGADLAVFFFIFEDFCTARFGAHNVVDDYLERHGWRESHLARSYLESIRDSKASLFEVIAVNPGQSLKVQDLLFRGRPVTVWEESGSKDLVRWERLAGRIVTVNGKRHFTAGALHYRFDWAKKAQSAVETLVSEARKRNRKRLAPRKTRRQRRRRTAAGKVPPVSRNGLVRRLPYPAILSSNWTRDILQRVQAPRPEIFNTDGERMGFFRLRFPINGAETSVAALLDGIAGFERADGSGPRWVWYDDGSAPPRLGRDGGETPAGVRESEFSTNILGRAQIEAGALTLRVNSAERSELGHSLLSSRLGDLIGPPQASTQSVQEAMNESEPSSQPIVPPAEYRLQLTRRSIDDHYRRVLDEPLPVLGGKTLRATVRSKKGRLEVTDWLKKMEITEHLRAAREGGDPYDARWMWKELGIVRPR